MIKEQFKKQWVLVVSVLFVGVFVSSLLIVFKPTAERKIVDIKIPRVDVVIVKSEFKNIPILSQGRVVAAKKIKLSAEVSGRIMRVADDFSEGGYFNKGETLLTIDSREYQLGVVRAEAQVAAAEQNLIRAEAEAQQAKKDLASLSSRSKKQVTAYALREPQLKEAQAKLKAAKADYSLAQLKLEKTVVRAPFSGRLINKHADVGQYVVNGSLLADIYDANFLQIKLPISLPQLDLLLLTDNASKSISENQLKVKLKAITSPHAKQWSAKIKQLDSIVDQNTQLINLVAEIIPESNVTTASMLLPGTFVKAEINSIKQQKVFVLPRQSLHSNNEIWLLDEDNKLKKIAADILYKNLSYIYVRSGLDEGQKVIVSGIDSPISSMKLKSAAESN